MKHLTRFFLCSCLLLALNLAALAQHSQDTPPTPNALLIEPVETYGDIPWAQERKRLDSLAALLSDDPNLVGYIVVYAGRRACAGEAQARALRAKNYLVGKRGVAGDRLVWRDAGHLSKPQVILETQVRGARQYPYAHPEPLPAKEVQILSCRGVMRKGKVEKARGKVRGEVYARKAGAGYTWRLGMYGYRAAMPANILAGQFGRSI